MNTNGLFKCLGLILTLMIFSGCSGSGNASVQNTTAANANNQMLIKAERIEVVHFHGTLQCWSCITVGEFALKTIKQKFPKEYSSGKIVFRDINGELPENIDIVMKYQARGSSLFINAITDENEYIVEDTRVWRLILDEKSFMDYFEGVLRAILI